MSEKKFFTNESLATLINETKNYVNTTTENMVIVSNDAIEVPIVDPYIRYDKGQALTEEEKAQVRANIGTLSVNEIATLINQNITSSIEDAIGGSY
jgi:hypothetical protein